MMAQDTQILILCPEFDRITLLYVPLSGKTNMVTRQEICRTPHSPCILIMMVWFKSFSCIWHIPLLSYDCLKSFTALDTTCT